MCAALFYLDLNRDAARLAVDGPDEAGCTGRLLLFAVICSRRSWLHGMYMGHVSIAEVEEKSGSRYCVQAQALQPSKEDRDRGAKDCFLSHLLANLWSGSSVAESGRTVHRSPAAHRPRSCLVLSINHIHCGNEFRNSVPVRPRSGTRGTARVGLFRPAPVKGSLSGVCVD